MSSSLRRSNHSASSRLPGTWPPGTYGGSGSAWGDTHARTAPRPERAACIGHATHPGRAPASGRRRSRRLSSSRRQAPPRCRAPGRSSCGARSRWGLRSAAGVGALSVVVLGVCLERSARHQHCARRGRWPRARPPWRCTYPQVALALRRGVDAQLLAELQRPDHLGQRVGHAGLPAPHVRVGGPEATLGRARLASRAGASCPSGRRPGPRWARAPVPLAQPDLVVAQAVEDLRKALPQSAQRLCQQVELVADVASQDERVAAVPLVQALHPPLVLCAGEHSQARGVRSRRPPNPSWISSNIQHPVQFFTWVVDMEVAHAQHPALCLVHSFCGGLRVTPTEARCFPASSPALCELTNGRGSGRRPTVQRGHAEQLASVAGVDKLCSLR